MKTTNNKFFIYGQNIWSNMFIIIIITILLVFFFDSVSFAEEPKSYEELTQELKKFKKMKAFENGFRTIDIIFGWNNTFSQFGEFCDHLYIVLDSYHVITITKWAIISGALIYLGFYLGRLYGIAEGAQVFEIFKTTLPDSVFPIQNKTDLINIITNKYDHVINNNLTDIMENTNNTIKTGTSGATVESL